MTEKLTSEQIAELRDVMTVDSSGQVPRMTLRLLDHIAALETEISDWRACAMYDPMMEGPRFKGWNRSALDNCRKDYVETWPTHPTTHGDSNGVE